MIFRIGHGAYAWPNNPALCQSYPQALRVLLCRKVPLARAHRALASAAAGSHATCESRSPGRPVVEVVAVRPDPFHNR